MTNDAEAQATPTRDRLLRSGVGATLGGQSPDAAGPATGEKGVHLQQKRGPPCTRAGTEDPFPGVLFTVARFLYQRFISLNSHPAFLRGESDSIQ